MRARSALGALVLAAALLSGVSVAAAQETGDAVSVHDRAVADLWRKVRAKCVVPGLPRLIVDNAGISSRNTLTSPSVRDLLRAKLDAAFDDLFETDTSGWRREIGPADRDVLRAYANADAFGPNPVVDRYRDSYLLVTADVTSDSLGQYFMTLGVRGLGDDAGRCLESSEPMVLPEEEVGDPIVSLDDIFLRAANEMIRRAKGSTTLYLSAEVAGEGTAPDRWTETFIDETRYAIQTASREQLTRNLASEGPAIVVQPDPSQVAPDSQRWEGQVKVERKPDSYRVMVTVAPSGNHITERGRIPPDALPPVPVEQLRDVTYTPSGGKLLQITEDLQVFAGTFQSGTDVDDYGFRLDMPHTVEFDAVSLSGGGDPSFALYGSDGDQVAPLDIVSRSPTLRRYRLDAGIYRLRVQNGAADGEQYRLTARGGVDALLPLLPPGFQLTRIFRDWQVGVAELPDGRRACFAVTIANRWAPLDWRPIRPFIWFLVPDQGSASADAGDIDQRFDVANYYDPQSPIQAAVFGARQQDWPLPITVRNNQLQSLDAGDLMSINSLVGMTRGNTLVINGTTTDGRLSYLEYSLNGYQGAMTEMLANCGRTELRALLIKR